MEAQLGLVYLVFINSIFFFLTKRQTFVFICKKLKHNGSEWAKKKKIHQGF